MFIRHIKAGLVGAAALFCAAHPVVGQDRAQQARPPAEQQSVPIRRIEGLKTSVRDGVVLASDVWLPAAESKYPFF